MTTKYLQCEVFHHSKGEFVPTDIKVDNTADTADRYPKISVYDDIAIPIENDFTANGILLRWPKEVTFSDEHRQIDYIGTVDEIIQRVINENPV